MDFLSSDYALVAGAKSNANHLNPVGKRSGSWKDSIMSLFKGELGKSKTTQRPHTSRFQKDWASEYPVSYGFDGGDCPDAEWGRAKLQDISDLEARLWSEADHRMLPSSICGRTCIMGFAASDSAALIDYLEGAELSPNAFSASADDIQDIATTHETISMLVVNGDAFGDVSCAVDALKNLREIRPSMAVVLVSSKVSGDDLSADRKAICDATLRAPMTMARLSAAIDTIAETKTDCASQVPEIAPHVGRNSLTLCHDMRHQFG